MLVCKTKINQNNDENKYSTPEEQNTIETPTDSVQKIYENGLDKQILFQMILKIIRKST